MSPVIADIGEHAYRPHGRKLVLKRLSRGLSATRNFMLKTDPSKIRLFVGISGVEGMQDISGVQSRHIPAFIMK